MNIELEIIKILDIPWKMTMNIGMTVVRSIQ
jgi:hypothetical protein